MKKIGLLIALVFALSFIGMAQEWHGITSDSPVKMKKTLVSSTDNEIVVNVNIDGFYTKNVRTPEGKQVVVSVDKMGSMLEAGAPDLPMGSVPVIIGDRAEMKVEVLNSEYVDYKGIEVAPSKGNFSRQINPDDVPYTYGAMYQEDAFWPATQAYLEHPYILRDFRGQNIMVRPFAYNPVTKTLRVYTSMTIAVTKVGDNGENQKTTRRGSTVKVDPEQMAQYDRRFINFNEGAKTYPFLADNGEMLVICADQFMTSMQPFVNWKNQSGRPTTMVSVTTAGGNNADAIKSYITNLYNDPNHNLTYVLLVGDYEHITPHPFTYEGTQYSDIWFGMVEGTDYYPEVFVGRFSAQSDANVTSQVNKVLYYERDMQAGTTWADKGLGIGAVGAGSGHYGEDDYQHIDLIRDTLLHYTYSAVTELHQNGSGAQNATAAGISSTINSGVGIINYCNHGSVTSWGVCSYSTSNVNALTNDNKWPIVWSVACLNGKFNHTSECFAEAWMRATDNVTGVPTGAVGGMFSWISQPWQPPMYGQDEMVDILTEWTGGDQYNHTLAGASLNGAMGVLDHGSGSAFTATQHSWILFGDPSLMVRTANPTAMNVNVSPSTLMVGMNTLVVNAINTPYGRATLTNANGIVATANIVNGTATLTFPALTNVETLTLTVMGYNKVTEVISVDVIASEGAFIVIDGYTPTNVPCVETQTMSVTFKNVGADPTSGTTNVVLSSTNNNITFTDATGSFGPLAVNGTITLTDEFAFTVAAGVPDNTPIQIDFTATNGDDSWTGSMNVIVGTPIVEFVQMEYSGGVVAGETHTVSAVFHNEGHYQATNAVVTATTTSTHATIVNPTYTIGVIGVGEDGIATFDIAIDETCPESEVVELTFTLTADNGVTATGEGSMSNTCTVVFSLHDSYGDGWNGCKLVVEYSDGTPSEEMTITTGHDAEYVREISIGSIVTVSFVAGSYSSETSFEIGYQDGAQIYASSGTPQAGQVCQFMVNCSNITHDVNVTVNPEGAGNVVGAGTYPEGSMCTLQAVPNAEYSFLNWTVGNEVVSTEVTYSFYIMEDVDVIANFAPFNGIVIGEGTATDSYLPSYNYYKYGFSEQIYTADEIGGAGTITSIGFYNAGAEKTRSYDVYLAHTDKNAFTDGTDWVAISDDALVFSGTVTMAPDMWTTIYLTTPFEYNGTQNLLVVMDDNTGSYTNQPHMTCRVFDANGSQALTIWGDGSNYNPAAMTASGTLKQVKNQVRMEIEWAGDMHHVTVAAEPADGGVVTGGGYYTDGASATITATANNDYAFVYWTSGNEVVSTDASYTFTVTGDADFIAYFEFTYVPPVPQTYEIVVVADPEGYGVALGGGTYEEGDECTITAEAFEGFEFINWTEDGVVIYEDPVYTFTVNADRLIVANFEEVYVPQTYEVIVIVDPEDAGIVTGGGTYTFGDECTVTAEALNGYVFLDWYDNGELVSTDPEYSFIVTDNHVLVAEFTICINVNEVDANAFVIYPNPAEDKVFVEGESIDYVELYNAMGQKLMVVKGSDKMELDVTGYKEGVYYLRIIGITTRVHKIIIK